MDSLQTINTGSSGKLLPSKDKRSYDELYEDCSKTEQIFDMEWFAVSVFEFLTFKELIECESVCDMWVTHIRNNQNILYKPHYINLCATWKITEFSVHKKINTIWFRHSLDNINDPKYDINGITCYHFNEGIKCKDYSHYDNTILIEPKSSYRDAMIKKAYPKFSKKLDSRFNSYLGIYERDKNTLDFIENTLKNTIDDRKYLFLFRQDLNFWNKCKTLTKRSHDKVKKYLREFKKQKKEINERTKKSKEEKKLQIKRIKNLLNNI